MSLLLRIPARYVPPFVKKKAVKTLLTLTAEAFGSPAPPLRGLSCDDSLRAFAVFTRDETQRALRSGKDLTAIKSTLFDQACMLGARCRRWFRIRSIDDALLAARMLYSFCRIDFRGSHNGEIAVCACFFSAYYSGDICRVIASLDAGLLAGLTGGRRLSFNSRMTEGATTCSGFLVAGEPQ